MKYLNFLLAFLSFFVLAYFTFLLLNITTHLTVLLLLSFLSAGFVYFLMPYMQKISQRVGGRVFISLKELRGIWTKLNFTQNEDEIWKTLSEFSGRMVGTENVRLCKTDFSIETQNKLLSDYMQQDHNHRCFLNDDELISYRKALQDEEIPCNFEGEAFPYISPLNTQNSWYGHIAFSKKGMRQLQNQDYLNIFDFVVNQAVSFVEKGRILNLTRAQSSNLLKLLNLSKSISEIVDLDILLDKILETLSEIIPFDAGGIFLIDDEHKYFYARKIRGYATPDVENLSVKLELGIIGKAIRERKTFVIKEAKSDPNYYRLREETNAQLTTPLFVGEEIIGVFSLESNHLNYFEEQDIDYLDGFAGIAAIAIRNAKLFRDSQMKALLESEMINAAQVQSGLLPKHYFIPDGYDISSINIPSLQVGGDIFDLGGSNSNYLIAIGDVSGKGTSGAILMAVLFAGLRSTLKTFWEVRKNIEELNQLMVESTIAGKFATFFMAKLDAEKDELWYCNAGHNSPILIRQNGEIKTLDKGGIVLGFVKDANYEEEMVKIESGDIVILFTDGLEEAMNANEEEYGSKQIVDIVTQNRTKTAKQISSALVSDIKEWVGEPVFQDDMTLIILKNTKS